MLSSAVALRQISYSTTALAYDAKVDQGDRRGDTMTAYQSVDGTMWSVIRNGHHSHARACIAGLAVSSHSTAALATATFDHVAVSTVTVPVPRRRRHGPARRHNHADERWIDARHGDDHVE